MAEASCPLSCSSIACSVRGEDAAAAASSESSRSGDRTVTEHVDEDQALPVEAWTPAFEGQRPPFPPGHTLTLKHGAFSPRRIQPVAEQLIAELLDDAEANYLRKPIWRRTVHAWARAEARVLLLTAWLEDRGDAGIDSDGEVTSVLRVLKDWESRAEKARTRLGLDPLSAARLGRERTAAALDTAQLMAQLEKQERERDAHKGDGKDDDDEG